MNYKKKIAIITSHPIQYQAPLFKLISEEVDINLNVYFCWDFGVKRKSYDEEFGQKIKWDTPLLEGYSLKFLKNYSPYPSNNFFGLINFGIIQELFFNHYDILILYGWNSFTNCLAIFFAKLINTKVFIRGENPLKQELVKNKTKLFFKNIILRLFFKLIDGFLYIGLENKRFYLYYGVSEKKLFFTPYAVDNARFIKDAINLKLKRKELRNNLLDIKDDRPIILFVGKLIEKKRPMDLLRAYALLEEITCKMLVFIGDGNLRKELEDYVKIHALSNVIFLGFKNQTKLSQYYSISDIFVLPSGEGETWGLVVNEALCFGLPVIVSNIVGCAEDLIRHGKNGFIFKVGHIKELKNDLKNLLVSTKQSMKVFHNNSLTIIKKYNYESTIRILKKL